jgi:hypothetical protein
MDVWEHPSVLEALQRSNQSMQALDPNLTYARLFAKKSRQSAILFQHQKLEAKTQTNVEPTASSEC